jgi:hypothetical protein
MRPLQTSVLFACLLALGPGACATGEPEVRPQLGGIRVTVATAGVNRDIETLTFTVDIQPGGAMEPIPADAGFVAFENLPIGTYVIRLIRLPAQCRTKGPSRRRVTVSAGRLAPVDFAVTCGRPSVAGLAPWSLADHFALISLGGRPGPEYPRSTAHRSRSPRSDSGSHVPFTRAAITCGHSTGQGTRNQARRKAPFVIGSSITVESN